MIYLDAGRLLSGEQITRCVSFLGRKTRQEGTQCYSPCCCSPFRTNNLGTGVAVVWDSSLPIVIYPEVLFPST